MNNINVNKNNNNKNKNNNDDINNSNILYWENDDFYWKLTISESFFKLLWQFLWI